MKHFYQDKGIWYFKTSNRKQKTREIKVPLEMLEQLKKYRSSLGLSPLPYPDEETSLIVKGSYALKSLRQLRRIFKICINLASENLKRAGHIYESEKLTLTRLSNLKRE